MADREGPAEPPAIIIASHSTTATKGATEQSIDPWSVSAATDEKGNALAFDYVAISRKWSTSLIDDALLQRFERLTGRKPHRWLRRGLFFSHRDFEKILDSYEKGETILLYTGRGPSGGSMHVGHTIPFEFTKWLQDAFDMPLVIMMTDDEKFLFKEKLTVEECMKYSEENTKDVIAFGFDVNKTFIFSDFNYMGGHFYQNTVEFAKLLPWNQVRGAFGFDNSTNVGRVFFPAVQCVAAFASSYPELFLKSPDPSNPKSAQSYPRSKDLASIQCLIPCAIDQDPYFRLLRDNAHRMRNPSPKPALIHSKFVTALQGPGGKMSTSDPNSAVFMSDTAKEIKNKINKHAFSGGGATLEEHRAKGGRADVDVPYQYLSYFLEDDEELENLRVAYEKGELLTGEMKKKCIEIMQAYVADFQAARKAVTDAQYSEYVTPRKLVWGGNPKPNKDFKPAPAPQKSTTPSRTENGNTVNKVEKVTSPPTSYADADTESDSEGEGIGDRLGVVQSHVQRPGLEKVRTYGVSGLSSYSGQASELLYPTKSGEEREQRLKDFDTASEAQTGF